MQSLVNYGSDSDDESVPAAPTPSTAFGASITSSTPSNSKSSFLNLPPPRASTSTATTSTVSNPSTTTTKRPLAPLKKSNAKGVPVRILLDLPPPSAPSSRSSTTTDNTTADDERTNKKPKLSLGTGGGATGLAAMLPKPKNDFIPPSNSAANGSGMGLPPPKTMISSTMPMSSGVGPSVGAFIPHSVKKGKGKAVEEKKAELESREEAVQDPSSGLDFFGLGSVTSAPSLPSSSSTLSKPTTSSISSAPVAPILKPAAPKGPTASDPYPGFTQLPSGEWVAKDQATYDLWLASVQNQQQSEVPKEFIEAERSGQILDMNEEEISRKAWSERPERIPGQDWEKEKEEKPKVPVKAGQYRARQKGQLSALLADAVENRAELEERIARGKMNRKAAGNRYGF